MWGVGLHSFYLCIILSRVFNMRFFGRTTPTAPMAVFLESRCKKSALCPCGIRRSSHPFGRDARNIKNRTKLHALSCSGAPEGIRTPDLLIRREQFYIRINHSNWNILSNSSALIVLLFLYPILLGHFVRLVKGACFNDKKDLSSCDNSCDNYCPHCKPTQVERV